MLHKGYTKFIMPAGIMSSARITYIGLTGYLMIHPVFNRINPNPVKFRMDDRISGLIGFGAHLYVSHRPPFIFTINSRNNFFSEKVLFVIPICHMVKNSLIS